VVDGTRLKRDPKQFLKAMSKGMAVGRSSPVQRVFSDKCVLLQDWAESDAPVFFDYGDGVLWWRIYKSPSGAMYIARVLGKEFVEFHKSGVFGVLAKDISKQAADVEAQLHRPQPPQGGAQSPRGRSQLPLGIQRYNARRRKRL